MGDPYDAVIVGARCAGSATAIELARAGWRVLLVDKATFPSDTISTHFLFPNGLARLEALGVMDTLRSRHELAFVEWRWAGLGQEWGGRFTPVDGYEHACGIRRTSLDAAMVDTALAAGAEGRFGEKVVSLVGADPVAGVVLGSGEEIGARWVIGADGRRSFVARALGLEERDPMRGDLSILFAYYTGLPDGPGQMILHHDAVLTWSPNEDRTHCVMLSGGPSLTSGTAGEREARFQEGIRRFPEALTPEHIDAAERISELRVAPETMMRGFLRQAAGPGWALVGDAGHFKHPATAQGIGDAVEQASELARRLAGDDGDLSGYEAWRDARAAEHYPFSFRFARMPDDVLAPKYFAGIASEASQEFRDCFSRLIEPSQMETPERMARWLS